MISFIRIAMALFISTACITTMDAAILDYDEVPLNIQNQNDRPGAQWVEPLDQPDVYFDSDEMALSLYGWDSTLASYYVEVVDYYGVTVASETVAGYGWQTVYLDPDTSSGTATVTITTSRGDEYSGTFYVP